MYKKLFNEATPQDQDQAPQGLDPRAVLVHLWHRHDDFINFTPSDRNAFADDLKKGLAYINNSNALRDYGYRSYIHLLEVDLLRIERNKDHAGKFADFYTYCDCGRGILFGSEEHDRLSRRYGSTPTCSECRGSRVECPHCHDLHDPAHLVEVIKDGAPVLWCRDCATRYSKKCSVCGKRHSDILTAPNGARICKDCATAKGYNYCKDCGRLFNGEGSLCFTCECRSIRRDLASKGFTFHSYSHKPTPHFYGEDKEGRFFGVELEVTAPDDNCKDYDFAQAFKCLYDNLGDRVYCKSDSSINDNDCHGFEIVSHPHAKEELYTLPWDKVCDGLRNFGYMSHDGGLCGLHFHISRDGFGKSEAERDRAIGKLIYFFDTFAEDIGRVARRGYTRWAEPNGTAGSVNKAKDKGKKANKRYNDESRYHNINITNAKTVEARVFRGTLNHDTLRATIDFVATIARNATRVSWSNINRVDLWLAGLKYDTIEYLKSRNAFRGFIQ